MAHKYKTGTQKPYILITRKEKKGLEQYMVEEYLRNSPFQQYQVLNHVQPQQVQYLPHQC